MKRVVCTIILAGLLLGISLYLIRPKSAAEIFIPPNAATGDLSLETTTIKLRGTDYPAESGWIYLPEDYRNPDTRLIALPVIRIRAKREHRHDPVFYLGGGPGHSNMGARPHPDDIQYRDFVLVGYRGVDGFVVLDSPEIRKAMRGKGKDLLDRTSIGSIIEASRRYAERLAREGLDLFYYAIPDVVEDLEQARKALGYDRINLRSRSYGTRVALLYKSFHPNSILPPRHTLCVGAEDEDG